MKPSVDLLFNILMIILILNGMEIPLKIKLIEKISQLDGMVT